MLQKKSRVEVAFVDMVTSMMGWYRTTQDVVVVVVAGSLEGGRTTTGLE